MKIGSQRKSPTKGRTVHNNTFLLARRKKFPTLAKCTTSFLPS